MPGDIFVLHLRVDVLLDAIFVLHFLDRLQGSTAPGFDGSRVRRLQGSTACKW